jgi:NTE family protein
MRAGLGSLLVVVLAANQVGAQTCPSSPLGLVLAGGGAKGFAHVGVLHALDSLGIRPDVVVGTSIGAIVGALYAGGQSARQIDSLFRTLPVEEAPWTPTNRTPHAWSGLFPLLVWEQGSRNLTLATGGGSELRTNAVLNQALLRANLAARGDFDSLPIRFRAIATDLRSRETVVLRDGDLAQAVRASIAIPLLLPPVRIGGRILIDGGISANLPVAAARAAGARRVIVVDLKDDISADSGEVYSPGVVAGRLVAFLFRQPPDSLGPDDVYIWPDVRGFANLDYRASRREQLIKNGRSAADSLLRKAPCFPRRAAVEPRAPPRYLSGWEVVTGTDRETVGRVLGLSPGQAVDVSALEAKLAELPNVEAFREIWLGPAGWGDTVFFRAQVVRAPRRAAGLGLAYDYDLGGRLWLGGLDRTAIPGAEAGGILTLGRFKSEFTATVLSHLGVGRASVAPLISLRLLSENARQFIGNTGNFENRQILEGAGTVAVEWARLGTWRARAGGVAILWRTPEGEDQATGGTFLSVSTEPGGRIQGAAEVTLTGEYQLGSVELGAQLSTGRLLVTPGLRAGVGQGLPLQTEFEFGGANGFPGLQVGERRGDREFVAQVQSSWRFRGPVSLRFLVAAGRSATGGSLFESTGWLAGFRAGVGATTPIGPVNLEYGFASNGSRAAFIRVGQWF